MTDSSSNLAEYKIRLRLFSKSAFGIQTRVYKRPRALYTNFTQTFIYFETVSKL